MAVLRIVPNVATDRWDLARSFYGEILEMNVAMDHDWIVTLKGPRSATPQVSFAAEGGSGAPVPDLSIEVDDLDHVLRRVVEGGFELEYGPVAEPWGVRRFFVRDPFGRLLNILVHEHGRT